MNCTKPPIKTLLTLIADPEKRASMGQVAADHATHFDIARVAADYLALFEQAMSL